MKHKHTHTKCRIQTHKTTINTPAHFNLVRNKHGRVLFPLIFFLLSLPAEDSTRLQRFKLSPLPPNLILYISLHSTSSHFMLLCFLSFSSAFPSCSLSQHKPLFLFQPYVFTFLVIFMIIFWTFKFA